MKKSDLKKLAVLGITGGILMSSQASADTTTFHGSQNFGTYLAGGGCGGSGSCGGSSPKPQNGSDVKRPVSGSVDKPVQDENINNPSPNTPDAEPKLFSRTNRFNRSRLIAENDEKPVEKIDEKKVQDKDSNKNIAISGTNNGQKYPTMNHNEGELAESRIISQLSKENLEKYRKMGYEGKQLTRKIARETGDPNKAVLLAEKQLEDKNASAKPAK